MKKKLVAILLSVLMLLACIPLGALGVSAESVENGLIYEIANGEVTITGRTDDVPEHLVIPATIEGYPVTAIDDYAFSGCSYLVSVTMPDSVTSIGDNAFAGCTLLTDVTLPDSACDIGGFVFSGTACYNDSANWVDGALYIDRYLCQANSSATGTYFVKQGTIAIAGFAFEGSSISSIVLPEGLLSISGSAFIVSSNLDTVILPKSVKRVSDGAFDSCRPLTVYYAGSYEDRANMEIGDSYHPGYEGTVAVDPFKGGCWYYNYHVSEQYDYTIDDGQATIVKYKGTDKNVIVPSHFEEYPVVKIGSYDSYHLTQGSWMPIYSSGAFEYSGMKTLTIPQSVTRIEYGAFLECNTLTDVYYAGTEEERNNIVIVTGNDPLLNATWHYNFVNPKDNYSPDVQHSVMDTENGNGLAFKFELTASVGIKNQSEVDYTNATINYFGQTCKLIGVGAVITNQEDTTPELGNVNGVTVVDIPIVYLTDWKSDSCAFATRIINIPNSALERTLYACPYYIVELDGEQIVVYGDIDSASCAEYM